MAAPYPSFPASPTIGQTYTDANGAVWTFGNIGWTKTLVSLTSDPSIWQDIDSALSYDSSGNITITGGLTAGGNVNIDSGTFYVDAVNNRVGVGTASPGTRLHVEGDTATIVRVNGSSGGGGISFQRAGTTTGLIGNVGVILGTTDSALGLFAETGFDTRFYTNGSTTERLRLDASGNLGLGVVPKTWTLSGILEGAYGSFGATNSFGMTIAGNAYYNGAWKYKATSTSTLQLQDSTGFKWYTAGVGTQDTDITFTQAMTLDTSGNLGIGATSSLSPITVERSGAISAEIKLNQTGTSGRDYRIASTGSGYGSAGNLIFYDATAGAERMRIGNTGRTQIFSSDSNTSASVNSSQAAGTSVNAFEIRYSATSPTDGTASLVIRTNGNVLNTNNSYGAISDIKLKENIVDATSQWSDIKSLQVRKYNFKEGQTHTQIGLIAQEVELVSPGLVSESPDRDAEGNDLGTVTKSVNYSVLYMKAVKALQEAIERIETLEAKVAALESR